MPAGAGVITFPSTAMCSVNADFSQHIPDFSSRLRKGGALQAAEKPHNAVILSAAKDLALSIFKAMRDSSSPAAPQNDSADEFFRSLFSPAVARPS
jgi:hypothetical protein